MKELNTKLRIAGIIDESIVDGPGIRLVVFTQGCNKHCYNCHNPKTWDVKGGFLIDDSIILDKLNNPLIQGVTISGGEPFLQQDAVLRIVKLIKERGLDIVIYSGHTLDELLEEKNDKIDEILSYADYLCDGPYIEDLRNLDLEFRGSSNQRFIKLNNSR